MEKPLDSLSCTFHSCEQLNLEKIDLEMEGNKIMGISGTSSPLVLW